MRYPVVSQSMIKTFKRCAKQFDYKFEQGLRAKAPSLPLKMGSWMHLLLEEHYRGNGWEDKHAQLTAQFHELFDEEQDRYGDLPVNTDRLMRSYLWHYAADRFKVHEVELTLETEFPDGRKLKIRIDMLAEDQFGLWLVDHKTHRTLPGLDFRVLDFQSALYLWVALRNKIPVQGFIWNYLRTKAPTIPEVVYHGRRLSARKIETDFLTMVRTLKEAGLKTASYKDELARLRAQRYAPGEPQTSPFFRRDTLGKSRDMLKLVASDAFKTGKRIERYFPTTLAERTVGRGCSFDCQFLNICTTELFGGDSRLLRRQHFTISDNPFDYYEREEEDAGEGA